MRQRRITYPAISAMLAGGSAIQSGYIKPQLAMMYNLSSDLQEDFNLCWTDLTNG
jgi:hypothetical protein